MKNFDLTAEQVQELREAHRLAKRHQDARAAYKINAVILLGSGWSLDEVVEALLIDDEAARTYAQNYKAGGVVGLLETHYKGSKPKLDDNQIKIRKRSGTPVYLSGF
jgi:predicted nucleic acid-binding protein